MDRISVKEVNEGIRLQLAIMTASSTKEYDEASDNWYEFTLSHGSKVCDEAIRQAEQRVRV